MPTESPPHPAAVQTAGESPVTPTVPSSPTPPPTGPPETHSPVGAADFHEGHDDEDEVANGGAEAVRLSTPYTAAWPWYGLLFASCLAVAAASLGGNAARVALERRVLSHPFFAAYDYIMPNSIGCFVMGLMTAALPPEASLPLVYRALCVGFCGSFTTFSTWIVQAMTQRTAAAVVEHLLIGGTMPVVFLLWGRDGGRALRWCGEWALGHRLAAWESCNALLRAVDLASAALLILASILAPVLVQVHITSGRIRTISTDDVRMVVLAPAGAVPRYLLSVYLNKRAGVAQFPLGTLAANLLGVLLAIVLYNMELVHPSNAWYVMVQQGICGALSTVSSLVNELVGFYGGGRAPFAYLYALVSVGVGIFIAGVGRPQIYGRSGA